MTLIQADRTNIPNLNYNQFGNEIGILGDFDSLSFYTANSTDNLNQANDSNDNNKIYLRNSSSSQLLAEADGSISNMQVLTGDTILINGEFHDFNGQPCQPPIIYNITSKEITNIFSRSQKRDLPSLDGSIKTTFIDNGLIYIGGNFTYENSTGIVIYNQTSQQLLETPFRGFGENAVINAITKQGGINGSLLFGGEFETLGIPQLLLHNISADTNSTNHSHFTNTSLITAEQIFSLKHGMFSDVNGDGSDPSLLICPSTDPQWSLNPNTGGQWLVELPDQMKGLTPTKARIYIPTGDDSVNLFRIYSYPNNGIMNLTYVDPLTNEIQFCDAWCPLSTLATLKNATSNNAKSLQNSDLDEDVYVDDNGSFATYYDSSTQTKTLEYGSNFQDFAFVNEVALDQIGITVISWYGSKASLAGFELYLNSIIVYGNETLNEPNCGKSTATDNHVDIISGDFVSVTEIDPQIGSDYMVSKTGGKLTLTPNITYSGDYSIIILTPGCIQDNSCDLRGSINASVYDNNSDIIATTEIWQTNDYDKFDYLFYGHLDGSLSGQQIHIDLQGNNEYMVVDKVRANIVDLDEYYAVNSTNHTGHFNFSDSELTQLHLNGLFEYSIANFTGFDITKVYNGSESHPQILTTNTFVGNSSLNVLSSELSNVTIKELNINDQSLVVVGSFGSNSVNLLNPNVINISLGDYNATSHSITTNNKSGLLKRQDVFGANFNDSVSDIANYYDTRVLMGEFTVKSDSIVDLSSLNKSTSSANNFVLYNGDGFVGFGNPFIDQDFDTFTNITIKSTEYFIFAASSTGYSMTWDNTRKEFITDPNQQLNITQSLPIGAQQIISGSDFAIPDLSLRDIGFVNKSNSLNGTAFNITGSITKGYYINETVSVVGGDFQSGSAKAVGFLTSTALTGLHGIDWKNSTIQTLYVDAKHQYLIVGFNGTITVQNDNLDGGIVVYDLTNNSITNFQPAQLSANSVNLQINSVALYNAGNKLLVGGNFNSAGSLGCSGLCIYDLDNTRWESPVSGLSGAVNDIVFIKSDTILITGDLTYNSNHVNFIQYDVKQDKFIQVSRDFNNVPGTIDKIVISEGDNAAIGSLTGRFLAYSNEFIIGFDGSKWSNITGIDFSNTTRISDVKVISSENTNSNQTYFSKTNVALVSGQFNLTNNGLINIALFDGKMWYPWIYSTLNSRLGHVNSVLIKDQYRSLSSDDLSSKRSILSRGKVVGISLACALGSITVLSLIYLIPYFYLFRNKDEAGNERIGEKEMMDAVNPQELFHEIDLHRRT